MKLKGIALIISLLVVLIALVMSPAGSPPAISAGAAPLPTPTPVPPVAVEGTVLHGHGATLKPGYSFVKREDITSHQVVAVDVVSNRHYFIVGTYVCPCDHGQPNSKCEIVFNPVEITCKGGSCPEGTCRLTAAPRLLHQSTP